MLSFSKITTFTRSTVRRVVFFVETHVFPFAFIMRTGSCPKIPAADDDETARLSVSASLTEIKYYMENNLLLEKRRK